jgi:hypothetical protein
MPQFVILEGALSGIGSALGVALLGIALVALHMALPFLIPITVIVIAVWTKSKFTAGKVKALPPTPI